MATQAGDLLKAILERIGATARAETVFGEARDLQGKTIVPVARVSYGFGAGSGWRGAGAPQDEGGGGGGGGLRVTPVGYLVSDGVDVQFRRIEDWRRTAAVLGVGALLGLLLASRLRRR